MRIPIRLLSFFAIIFPTLNAVAQLYNPAGNVVIFSNYEGGILNIDVDVNIPNLKIGVTTYEAVQINIAGAFAANVSSVIYAGYNGQNSTACGGSFFPTTVNGVNPSNVKIFSGSTGDIAITTHLGDPDPATNIPLINCMVGASGCFANTNLTGGVNSSPQIVQFFLSEFGPGSSLRSHFTDYGCFPLSNLISAGGNCCFQTPSGAANPIYVSGGGFDFIPATADLCNGNINLDLSFYPVLVQPPVYTGYVWSNGVNGPLISISSPGTYSFTVTDYCHSPPINALSDTIVVSACCAVTAAVNGPSAVCSGDTAVFAAVAAGGSGNYTFEWSNGSTNDSLFLANPVSGLYFLVVTDIANACDDTVYFNLAVNPNPVVNVSGQTQLCSGDAALLQLNNSSPSPNDLYVWSTGTVGNTLNISSPVSGNYFGYVVNNQTGCRDTVFFTLTVSPTPQISYTGNTTLCSGQSLVLNASSSSAGISFTWSNGTSGPALNIANPASGLLTLTGTDPLSSCFEEVNINVQVITSPQPVFINPQLQICAGSSQLYVVQVNGGSGNFSYLWSTGQVGNPITISNFPGGNLECTVTDLNTGCTGTSSVNLTLIPLPQVFFLQQPSGGCPGVPLTFEAGVAGGSGNYDYQWSTGDNTALMTWANPASGQIQCVITDLTTSCSALLTTTLTLFPEPQLVFDQLTSQVCQGNSAFFSVSTSGGSGNYTYAWSTGQSGTFVSFVPAQPETLSVVVTDQSTGCTDTVSTFINLVTAPTAEFSANTPVCQGFPLSLQNSSQNSSGYLWNFGNGALDTASSPNYLYSAPGTYQISLVAFNGGCADTAFFPVEIGGFPEIDLGEARVEDWDVYIPFSIDNPGFTTVDWGDGTTEQEPSQGRLFHGYSQTGTYTIIISSVQPPGCFDSDTAIVEVIEPLRLFLPSSFTPNGDELNDVLLVVSNLKSDDFFELRIFNRWGQQFYKSNDPLQGWDGTYRGKDSPEGLYLYELSYSSERARKKGIQISTGQINLLR